MRWLQSLLVAAVLAGIVFGASAARAQNNNNNNNNATNTASALVGAAGVVISADGVLRYKPFTDRSGELTRTRMAESRARLGSELTKASSLRKISLQRLEAAVAERLAAGKEPTDEMKALAGLTRLQYVFYYPDSKDIVIAGPAEGFYPDFTGRILGLSSGRAVLELQDLVAALRAFPAAGRPAQVISVSIDPTQEGLARMQQFWASVRPTPGDAAALVDGFKRSLGLQVVTINGVSPRTHFAQVLVEADYRMKMIGIGMEPPPVRMATYIDRASSNETLQRWFFVPHYECLRVADDDLAMELVGQGVKLVGESELVAVTGQRAGTGNQSKASKLFCQAFTENYPKIAARNPVYGQLRNLIDLAIAAAFIQKQDYYAQSGWRMETFGDERQLAIETYEAPKNVEPVCTAVWKGNRLMTPIGGGVQLEPLQAVQPANRLKDDKGTVKQARAEVKLDHLANGQWWWD
jgi:hypothetical protein